VIKQSILFLSLLLLTIALVCQMAQSETPGSDRQAVLLAKAAQEATGMMPSDVAIKANAMVLEQNTMEKGSMQWLAQGPRAWRSELQLPDGNWS
jgi:hypothetical protein